MSKTKVQNWADDGKSVAVQGRCYESHPALDIAGFKIYGGSCYSPIVKNADIYIGLDSGMQRSHQSYPWEQEDAVIEVCYPVTDMSAPKDPVSFRKMIEWVALQLTLDKLIHVGCIGGHGRTGTFFAALVATMTGEKDAIQYVRDNYCQKAVESIAQMEFLRKHYGVNPAEPTKQSYSGGGVQPSGRDKAWYGGQVSQIKQGTWGGPSIHAPMVVKSSMPVSKVTPAHSHMFSVWGANVVFDKRPEPAIITALPVGGA